MWKILDGEELLKLKKRLFERYGIEEMPYTLIKSGKRRYRISTKEAAAVKRALVVGVYVLKETPFGLMFSVEGTQLLGPFAKKNVLEIPQKMVKGWMEGNDINIGYREELEPGIVIIKSEDLYLGSGLYDGKVVKNLLPRAWKVANK